MIKVNDDIFNFAYGMALADATRRTDAASINKTGLSCLLPIVKEYANSVINGDHPDFCKYEEKCETALEAVNITIFTFGNIQKLINMTMKYLYVGYYMEPKYREYFKCCHAPMDARMRDFIFKRYKAKGYELPKFDKECAWSKMGRKAEESKYKIDNYFAYQEAIAKLIEEEGHNACTPIEFEFLAFAHADEPEYEINYNSFSEVK